MPIISNITSQATSLNSTMDLIVNQGSTTVRMTAAQIVAGMGPDASTAAVGALVYLKSTVDTTVLSAPTNSSGSLLFFSSGTAAPAWLEISSGEIVYGTSAGGGVPTALAAPSAGGILQFSTVDGSIGPRWLDMSSGSLIRGSSVDGNPLELAVGTDGQILESSGSTLHWVTRSDVTTLADPTSESLLWHKGGSSAGEWIPFDQDELVRFSTLGILEAIQAPSSGAIFVYTTATGTSGAQWLSISTGSIIYGTSLNGAIADLAAPANGAVMVYSTVNGSSRPSWLDMSSGGIIRGSSIDGNPLVLAVGSDGQILESSGSTLHWITPSAVTTLADPSSESLLWHAGGSSAPAWIPFDAGELVRFSTLGILEAIAVPAEGAILNYTTATGSSGWAPLFLTSGQLLIGSSADGTTVFAVPSSGAVLTHSSVNGAFGPAWLDVSTGELVTRSSDGTMKSLAIPSSDSILQFSTVDGSLGPIWLTPGDGELLISDADGDLDFLTIGSSGQILQSTGGIPTWVAPTADSTSRQLPAQAWSPTADASSFASATLQVKQASASVPSPRWHEWLFSTVSREYIVTQFIMPPTFTGTGTLDVYIKGSVAGAAGTSNVTMGCFVHAYTGGDDQDIDADAFASSGNETTVTMPTTAGHMVEVAIVLTNDDSMTAGDFVTLGLYRDSTNASDLLSSNVEFLGAELRWS